MAVTSFKHWLGALLLAVLSFNLASAKVVDPAKDTAQYHKAFPLFRSSNMAGADKLASGTWLQDPESLLPLLKNPRGEWPDRILVAQAITLRVAGQLCSLGAY